MDQKEQNIVESPLYLFTVEQACYSCCAEIETIAIATNHLIDPEYDDEDAMNGEVCLLSDIESLPREILDAIQAEHPSYQARHSHTAGFEYLMTVCKCGAHQGDHYVHQTLFNAACNEPDTIRTQKLQLEGRWEISCGYSTSSAYDGLIDRANRDAATDLQPSINMTT